jgi:hypothetical protein
LYFGELVQYAYIQINNKLEGNKVCKVEKNENFEIN